MEDFTHLLTADFWAPARVSGTGRGRTKANKTQFYKIVIVEKPDNKQVISLNKNTV